jgi:tetratricopeptide (TPR) repeat protein
MYLLSLLSKPTIIAMPVLMLLLDFWPLRRISRRAILEKIAFFAIAVGSAVVTYISQSRTSLAKTPGESGLIRIVFTICHNIVFYLYNFLWPNKLSWYYPYPKPFDLSHSMVLAGLIGTVVLIAVLVLSLRWTRCVLVGWVFFFAAIFPTLGIVGFHPVIAADRHMYFPIIGLLLPVGWLLCRLGKTSCGKIAYRIFLISAFVILMVSEVILTRNYLVHWGDSERVYRYMLNSSPDVAILHNNLANVLSDSDEPARITESVSHFERSLKLKPGSPEVYNNLGNALSKLGREREAIKSYKEALKLRPKFAVAYFNLGTALSKMGDTKQAVTQYRLAIKHKPDYIEAWTNLGIALSTQGEMEEAATCYRKALEYEPGYILAHGQLGLALARLGQIDDAIKHLRVVLKALPNDKEMHFNIGYLLEHNGKIEEAAMHYRQALSIDSNYHAARERLEGLSKTPKNP